MAAAEGAAPAERGGDAGAGWRGLGGGAEGSDQRRSRRRALELQAHGEQSRAAGAELEEEAAAARLPGKRVGDGELGSGTAVGWSWVRGVSEPCVQEAAAAAQAQERKEACRLER